MIIWTPMDLDTWERIAIEGAMLYHKGVKLQAARTLNIAPRTLDAKLEKYALDNASQEKAKNELDRKNKDYLSRARATSPQFRGSPETGFNLAEAFGTDETGNAAVDAVSPAPQPGEGTHADGGLHVESVKGVSGPQPVSVPANDKSIQKVLSGPVAASGSNRRR